MIKLKDILNESMYKPNEPIGKVITDKDHPPFMTEDQWMQKWTQSNLTEHYQLTESDKALIREGKLTKEIGRTLRTAVATMLRFVNKKHIPVSFKTWPEKAKRQYLKKVASSLPIYNILQKYLMTGRVSSSDMKTLGDNLRKYNSGIFAAGGIVGFTIGLIFSPAAATGFAAWAGALVLGTMSEIIWRLGGLEWFMAGIEKDSQRKAMANKIKKAASKNLSNTEIKLPKKVGNINLQSYDKGDKSFDPKNFQPFGFRTRL